MLNSGKHCQVFQSEFAAWTSKSHPSSFTDKWMNENGRRMPQKPEVIWPRKKILCQQFSLYSNEILDVQHGLTRTWISIFLENSYFWLTVWHSIQFRNFAIAMFNEIRSRIISPSAMVDSGWQRSSFSLFTTKHRPSLRRFRKSF